MSYFVWSLFFFNECFVPMCWWSISLLLNLLKPYSPRPAFRFPRWLTDLSSLLYQGSPSFFCCWGRWCTWCVCVRVCARVILFADLELIPFKTLLNTFEWDWLMFASTTAPSSSLNPKGNPGRQKQSVITEVSDGIWMLFAPRSVLYIVYDTHFWTHM